jgi:ketosteroid isomerase-like protein
MCMKWIARGMLMVTSAQPAPGLAAPMADQAEVSAIDIEYQAAVKRGDVATMDHILHPDFVLVRGDGRTVTRNEILDGARSGAYAYEQQDELPGTQTVRVWGNDTAVVTALLWIKGKYQGQPFDRRVWFSDTYVRTAAGWRYAFAQVSLPLPPEAPAD